MTFDKKSRTTEAIIGIFFAGSAWGDWSLYTSPLGAGREFKVACNFLRGETTSYVSFDLAKEIGGQELIVYRNGFSNVPNGPAAFSELGSQSFF